ncbi:MAG: MarR family transcriptional regulator [Ilumatobacter sp.]|uniref:MarR family winged helix-turn-helix transcriptional regulator n=1 Tax=Ilumatobacter sp. TaxID=1967498 RepID=UPI0032980F88
METETSSDRSDDHVDVIVEQWGRERPEVDVSAMAIIGRITRLDKLIRPRLDAVFARHGLESWEFDVLATLLRHGDPYQLTPGQLLESMMITSGAMTNRIDRLEQRGLVKRAKSPSDGRQVLVVLTEKGLETVDAALVDHAANEREIVDALTSGQRDQLVDLLRRLVHGVAEQPHRE